MFISLPFGTSLTFLLSLLSAILIAVAFRHLATRSSFYFSCFYFIFARAMAISVSPLFFSLLELPCHSSYFEHLSTIFNFSCHFYCHAIFIAAVHFVAVQPDSNYCSFSFKAWSFLLFGCCFGSCPVIALFILLLKTLSL